MKRRLGGIVAALAGISTVMAFGTPPAPVRAASTTPFQLFAPVYSVQQAAAWSALTATTGMRYLISVDLPNITNPATQTGMTNAVAAGKTVLGYLSAHYAPIVPSKTSDSHVATPPTATALTTEITALFNAAPQLGGIFLDEVSTVDYTTPPSCSASASFYKAIGTWMRANKPGKMLVLNAGTALCAEFAGAADAYLVFEDTITRYNTAFKPYYNNAAFDWLRALPDSQVWMMVYGADENSFIPVLDDMSDSAGTLYALDSFSAADVASGSYRAKLGYRATLTSPPTTTTTSTTTTTTTTIPPTTTTAAPGVSTTVAPVTTTSTTTTTTTEAPTTTTTTQAPALTGGSLVGSVGPRPVVPPVFTPTQPVVFTPVSVAPVIIGETVEVPASTTTTKIDTPTSTTVSTPPSTSPPKTVATTTTTVPPAAPAAAVTTTIAALNPVTLEVTTPSKKTPKIRKLTVRFQGTTPKKVVVLKNGKPLKVKPGAKSVTITVSKVPVTYVAVVTDPSGAALRSQPVVVQL